MANTPAVDQFLQTCKDLIGEAAAYGAADQSDPNMNAMLRQIQVMTAALQTALEQAALAQARRAGMAPSNAQLTPVPAEPLAASAPPPQAAPAHAPAPSKKR